MGIHFLRGSRLVCAACAALKEREMKVHQKLMRARIALQKTKLNKSGHNSFAKYDYFELGDFLPTVQNIFADVGLCGVVSFAPDVATLTITDVEEGGEIKITSPMSEANLKGCHPIQSLGAVETYQRRYLWVTAMEIVEHDALDATTGTDKQPDVAGIIKRIADSATLDVLRSNYEAAMQMLPESAHRAIKQATNARKAELTEKEPA